MEALNLVRVVTLHRGKLRAIEFRLRPGEKGLSVFAWMGEVRLDEIVEAVRALGKRGTLAAACIPSGDVHELGLKLLRTPGGTLRADINKLHYEIRVPLWKCIWLAVKRTRMLDYFNSVVAPELCYAARVAEES